MEAPHVVNNDCHYDSKLLEEIPGRFDLAAGLNWSDARQETFLGPVNLSGLQL